MKDRALHETSRSAASRWIAAVALALGAAMPAAHAAITLPSLGAQSLIGDAGMVQDATTVQVAATVFELVLTPGNPLDIVDAPLVLTAGKLTGLGPVYTSGAGTLQVGSLLSATFASLSVLKTGNSALFWATLQYTGGSLAAGLPGGRIEGTISGFSHPDLAGAFTAGAFAAQIGEITPVPLPPAAALFLGGALALTRLRRHAPA